MHKQVTVKIDLEEKLARYYIWTVGCQMNEADSERMASALEQLGCIPSDDPRNADIIVLNSCVVRQGVEDRVASKLDSLKSLKSSPRNPIIALAGCMVGPKADHLKERFPHTDLFLRPQELTYLLEAVSERTGACLDAHILSLPFKPQVSALVPIIHGCNKFCTFCVIPYRRGRERSRPLEEIASEVRALVKRGAKEVTLLGQNVDSYGNDLPEEPDLADLLHELNRIEGLLRIRFLTSHPNDMSDKLIEAVASLDRVCKHINLPVQAGDDALLKAMRRGYTSEEYRILVGKIRSAIPHVSLSTDVIVGFPGESEEAFQRTVSLLEDIRFDKVHVAMYSPRPGTIAQRTMGDEIPPEEKRRRREVIEAVQEHIAYEINAHLQGQQLEVLVEDKVKGKWQGRTRINKLVFFEDKRELKGELVKVDVEQTTAWSLRGTATQQK
ncbi:MAG: tRNA (N6-isopentenyl adenosine(37)-C2)-methylthiotransferase MiaB [Chloroflexi bacterium]|nr:tRNA (N6-isopentenyl adenosine(37)-C2)-methylthiotransferase MiaB [Chloroflexota bacterium]